MRYFDLKSSVCVFIVLMVFNEGANSFHNVPKDSYLNFNYHNHKSMTAYLKRFVHRYPNLVTLYSIGESASRTLKKELWVMKISTSNSNETLPGNIKLLANIHGNEAVGREVLLHFIEYLGLNYRTDEGIKHILKHNIIHILPSMNPDGFEDSTVECETNHGRYNAKDVDLNRNFPDFFHPNLIPMQPETKAVINWMKNNNFILSASLHGGAMVANYPFDDLKEEKSFPQMQESKTDDDEVFRYLASSYSKAHPKMHKGEGCGKNESKFADGITNGAAWYPFSGGMQDYNYAFHGCMEITLEISCCKYPSESHLQELWEENKYALIEYCLQGSLGIKGIVFDELTNEPIVNASLDVHGINMTFYTKKNGEFFRILLPGRYILKIDAVNYTRIWKEFTVIEPIKYPEMTVLKISLKQGDDSDDTQEFSLFDSTTVRAVASEEATDYVIIQERIEPTNNFENSITKYFERSTAIIVCLNQWSILGVMIFKITVQFFAL